MNEYLIIVDMINGFIESGNLADKAIDKITPEIVRLAKVFLNKGKKVIAFKDCHNINSSEFDNFPPHCVKGTGEEELINELRNMENDFIVFEKNSTNGFFSEGFADYISENSERIIVTGCCTDICVMNLAITLKNYFNQNNKNVEIIVPKNAVETYNIPNIHEREKWNEMAIMFMMQAGIKVVEKAEVK